MTTNVDQHSGASKGLDLAKWLVAILLLAVAVVGNAYFAEQPLLYRAIAGVVLVAGAAAVALVTARGREFNSFRKEAMVELRKIVWPTRPETIQTTVIVFVVVLIMAVVLYLLDLGIGFSVSKVIG